MPSKTGVLAAVMFAFGVTAQAEPIVTWNVNVDTKFDTASVVTDGGPNFTIVSDQELRWGTPATASGDSGLTISGSPANTFVDTNGAQVANVSVTHRNRPIVSGSGSLRSVDILSTLLLTPTVPGGAGLPPAVITFGVNFFETPNSPAGGICADGGANGVGVNVNGCADIFVIDQSALNFAFQYPDIGGTTPGFLRTYFISFLELTSGLNPLPAAACNSVPGVTAPCIGFRTPEDAETTVQFAALITTRPVTLVPEPGSLALVGLSLGLFGLIGRRQRKA